MRVSLLIVCFLVLPVLADPDPATLEQAHGHFKQGKAYLDAKVYDKAVVEFEAAYKLSPFPELVFNVAQAYRLADQPDKAIAAYQEYLASTPSGELADEARVHVAELTKVIDDRKAAAADQARRDQDARARRDDQVRAEHARQEAAYEGALRAHTDAGHKRRNGYITLAIGGLAVVGGIALLATSPPESSDVPIGGGLIFVGVIGGLVGGVMAAAAGNPYVPPPPPPLGGPGAHVIAWGVQF